MRFEAYVLIEVHTGSIMKEIKTDDIFLFYADIVLNIYNII